MKSSELPPAVAASLNAVSNPGESDSTAVARSLAFVAGGVSPKDTSSTDMLMVMTLFEVARWRLPVSKMTVLPSVLLPGPSSTLQFELVQERNPTSVRLT